ncbi:conserved hypothetical protein, partial [Ricinus communis]
IWEGDPLSPYIFVLCVERLGHGIRCTMNNKLYKPMRLRHQGPLLTYFLLMDVLGEFCICLAQKVSNQKTGVFFS